ncbi:MAG: class I SAM-dependent methyltransferase [Porticoccaceae bacterium]|nr:class I SAM-dependent methyltransferase [Porticoccaceae bacterium]
MVDRCPLCLQTQTHFFLADAKRDYWRCQNCCLIYVPKSFHLSPDDEKAHYDLHQNSPHDPGYRGFLGRLFQPMVKRLAPTASGLDFGCGPGPTLSVMFEESGRRVRLYDPYYARDEQALARSYDFVTATEVVEHFSAAGEELDRLWSLLNPGGCLGIMTKLALDKAAFSRWHYKNDPTHISFFSVATFNWLAGKWGVVAEFFADDVILFCKPPN